MKSDFIPNTPMKILLEEHRFFLREWVMVVIPVGFAYDGPSIPQAMQWVIDMNHTENIKAGLEHDFLYSILAKYICNRKEADQHFKKTVHGNVISKKLVYAWVRGFGWRSYHKDSNYKKYEKEIKEFREKMWMRLSIS